MTDNTRATLDRLMEPVTIGPAPIDDLLRDGQAAKRRKNRTVVAVAGALTASVAVGGGLAFQSVTDAPGPGVADTPSIAPATDTHMVGIGRVAVAVPTAWAGNDASCNTPIRDTYFFPHPLDCVSSSAPTVSSVAITDGPFTEIGIRVPDRGDGSLNGHRVVASEASCSPGQGEYCRQTFGVPDLSAYFTVTIPASEDGLATIAAIRDSLTILPDDKTTIPFTSSPLDPSNSEATTVRALQEAGFSVEIQKATCPPTASCVAGVTGVEPEPGSVVPVGSTVTVTVMGG